MSDRGHCVCKKNVFFPITIVAIVMFNGERQALKNSFVSADDVLRDVNALDEKYYLLNFRHVIFDDKRTYSGIGS